MRKQLHILQILVYYDIPEIFIATDEVGTKFLCLLVDVDNESILYISTAISANRLTEFINGRVDLREIFVSPESNLIYSFDKISESIEANLFDREKLPEEYLPEVGFKYEKPLDENKLILNEALEKNNAIVHLAVSDSNDNYSIDADDFGDIVKLYQVIIENSYKKEIARQSFKNKKAYYIPQNFKLRAFASSYSSFNLHMYSTSQVDLFGNSIIELGLSKFEEIIRDFDNDDEYIESLRTVKGHAISSLKKLIKKLIDCDIKIKHKWYSLGQENVHFSTINKTKAQKIYDILTLSEELAEERKEFEGYFVQVDVEKGTWRIYNIEDEKEYSGEAQYDLLQGVTVKTEIYKIDCLEIIEELKVAEKEKVKYILTNIERKQ
ncbi:MAG: DUF6575 domain-containing protein [bacterium]